MQFEIGHTYSKDEISRELGGNFRSSLPTHEGKVVCGCFKKIAQYNPCAPEVVTIGTKPRVLSAARKLSNQVEPIPIFLFHAQRAWKYMGDFHCARYTEDPVLLQAKMSENKARGPIGGVLYFEQI